MKFFSLRWKLSGIVVLSNLVLGVAITFMVTQNVTTTLEKELIERGRTIAIDIARNSAGQILEEDHVGLRQLVNMMLSHESVEYIIIHDSESRVIADTYNGQLPLAVRERPVSSSNEESLPHKIDLGSEGSICYDINEPVEEGSLGYVRVGMRGSYIEDRVLDVTKAIILTVVIITFIGIVTVYFVANQIVKPILQLAQRANEISTGKLEERVEATTKDEIKFLAEAVERLRESLNMALTRLKKHQTMRI